MPRPSGIVHKPARASDRGVGAGDVVPGDADAARRSGATAAGDPERRGLAGAVGAEQGHDLARGHDEVDAVQHLDASRSRPVPARARGAVQEPHAISRPQVGLDDRRMGSHLRRASRER